MNDNNLEWADALLDPGTLPIFGVNDETISENMCQLHVNVEKNDIRKRIGNTYPRHSYTLDSKASTVTLRSPHKQ